MDTYNPIIAHNKWNNIVYYSCRNSFKYLINNPKGLHSHYVRVYNKAFNQKYGDKMIEKLYYFSVVFLIVVGIFFTMVSLLCMISKEIREGFIEDWNRKGE